MGLLCSKAASAQVQEAHVCAGACHPGHRTRYAGAIASCLLAAACGNAKTDTPAPLVVDEQPDETYLVGVRAEDFDCESVLSTAQSVAIFGGRVVPMASPFSPPSGVPKSCNYTSHDAGREPIQWSFDLDCRDGALSDASKLLVSYADTPDAMPMRIGQSGLDHHDSSLLFIDDDTPCYGRVLGPDRDRRKQLGLVLVEALTPRSAPTGANIFVRE